MEGDALMLCFRLGLIRASSERPNQKHTITFLTEGHHPHQGDKQKKKRPILRRTALNFVESRLHSA